MSRKNVVGTSVKVRLTEDAIRRAEPLPPLQLRKYDLSWEYPK